MRRASRLLLTARFRPISLRIESGSGRHPHRRACSKARSLAELVSSCHRLSNDGVISVDGLPAGNESNGAACSLSGPAWRAVLSCGLRAFRRVLCRRGNVPHCLAETNGLQRRHVARAHGHLLHRSLRKRCSGKKASRQCIGLVEQSVMGDDPPDQTHRVCSLGVDSLPREQQLHRIGPVDALRQAYRCHDRRDSKSRPLEDRIRLGHSQGRNRTRWQA